MKKTTFAAIAALLTLGATAATADVFQDHSFSVGGVAGTLGVGVQMDSKFSENFGVHFGKSGMSANGTFEGEGQEFEASGSVTGTTMLVDYYPTGGAFRMSAGATIFEAKGDATSTFDLASSDFAPEYAPAGSSILTVDAEVEYDKLAPTVGLGWSGTMFKVAHVSFDVGAMYIGKANVSVTASGDDAEVEEVKAAITRSHEKLENALKDLNIYPSIQLSVGFQF